ncbi:hypothetical protein TVAG_281000 [Trichomonas vaginalis G3]|uniref:Uncharacterized protein n=1 Tax=Trichomonas vaginalis (strain ATCC PRA-98 / G3) TaxID=412133 RepID=A2DRM0_TRIV3|nr:hypothetical protein TVAGG3_0696730 [Trichomonas vaginalis G3]EAY16983.1 hypothetical protein TVAG_281000 [Trichomonas vaginalis G3]KAI5508970.1 hypothetical protein TVAGG3_0696730 [Trichomonas vaginalis G3]|eukprot:XP_001329206.1 hypothetical protein [Trichomonas vaginalis G3]
MTRVEFKFIDKFDRFILIERDINIQNYVTFGCYVEPGSAIQGDKVNILCNQHASSYEDLLNGYIERKLYFVNYADNNNHVLLATSHSSNLDMREFDLPVISQNAPLKILIQCDQDPAANQEIPLKSSMRPPITVDFQITDQTDSSANVHVTLSEDLGSDYQETQYAIGPSETLTYKKFSDTTSYVTKDFVINEQFPSDFTLTIRVKYLDGKYASKTITIGDPIDPIYELSIGKNQLKDKVYTATKEYKVLLQYGSTSAQVKAEMGGKN